MTGLMDINYQPTDNRNPLEAYTVNLTEKAKKGKLDPVIGRNEEIRRVWHGGQKIILYCWVILV
jgi:ATP-dependent Clp protease ATP-binding subunit ClpA